MAADRQAKRSAAQERLRGGFLSQLGPQLRELSELLSDGTEDGRDSAIAELERIGRTSGALGLAQLAEAAAEAAASDAEGATLLSPLARAVRQTSTPPLFAPLGFVTDDEMAGELRLIARRTTEPLSITTRMERLIDPLATVPWGALVVPAEQVAQARELAEDAPIIAWGAAGDWAARRAALASGAATYVARPDTAFDLLARVRACLDRRAEPCEVFVLADVTPARATLIEALTAAHMGVVVSAEPSELPKILDETCPDVLILGSQVGQLAAEELVRVARGHASGGWIPIVVTGDGLDVPALGNADDLLPAEVPAAAIADVVRRRYERGVASRGGRHPVSGLPDRSATLRALDRRLGHVDRSRLPLSIAILNLDGVGVARERWGRAAVTTAQRLCAVTVDTNIRCLDLVGQLDRSHFLVALQDCPQDTARRRLADISRKAELRLHTDHRLREVLCLFGVADTRTHPKRVASQAADDLHAVRRGSA